MTTEDIKRLNYILYSSFRPFVHNPRSLCHCLCSFFLQVLRALIRQPKGNCDFKEILFVVPTQNNKKSLKTVMQNLPDDKYSVWGDFRNDLPYMGIRLRSLLYLPIFLKLYYESDSNDRRLIRNYYNSFMMACGTYKTFEKLLQRNPQLKMIIMANDHILECRVFIELAERHHVKTLYVQHASVTDRFPPLRFSFSFLDGKDSYDKYKKIGNMSGEVFLSGSPRFDDFYSYRGNGKMYDVGIALNELDSIEKTMDLCLYLIENYSSKIIVRPHPAMLLTGIFDEEQFLKNGIAVSNPLIDLSYVFISCIKVMIANESGIHLDAVLMQVPSLLFNFSDSEEILDWYSYVKKGLVVVCKSKEEVVDHLSAGYKLSDELIRYYNASYKTPVEGGIGKMIAQFIKKEIFVSHTSARQFLSERMVPKEGYSECRYVSMG